MFEHQQHEQSDTVSSTPTDLIKYIFLERRKYALDALESVMKDSNNKGSPSLLLLRCRVWALFLEVRAALKRTMKPEEFIKLQEQSRSSKFEDLQEAFFQMNDWFDNKKIIRVDNIKSYDSTDVEIENYEKGL
jgi:hypothetical protein